MSQILLLPFLLYKYFILLLFNYYNFPSFVLHCCCNSANFSSVGLKKNSILFYSMQYSSGCWADVVGLHLSAHAAHTRHESEGLQVGVPAVPGLERSVFEGAQRPSRCFAIDWGSQSQKVRRYRDAAAQCVCACVWRRGTTKSSKGAAAKEKRRTNQRRKKQETALIPAVCNKHQEKKKIHAHTNQINLSNDQKSIVCKRNARCQSPLSFLHVDFICMFV